MFDSGLQNHKKLMAGPVGMVIAASRMTDFSRHGERALTRSSGLQQPEPSSRKMTAELTKQDNDITSPQFL